VVSLQGSVFVGGWSVALADKNQLTACEFGQEVLPESGFLFFISRNLGIFCLQVTVNSPCFCTPHPSQDQRQVWLPTSPGRPVVRGEFCVLSPRLTVPVHKESGAEGCKCHLLLLRL